LFEQPEIAEAQEPQNVATPPIEKISIDSADDGRTILGEANGRSSAAEALDPYAGIRSAMSPEHAELTANEISVVLGRMPATIVLHQMLHSPEMRMATLASFLGKAARRTVRLHDTDISIPAYLRLISRLAREVAEQSEVELDETVSSEYERPAAVPRGGKYFVKIDPTTLVVRAWLYDFDKNQGTLKRGHIDLLHAAIGPVLRDGGSIKLLGLASTTGTSEFDKKLGEARMHAVVNYLRAHFGNKFTITKEISFGKEMALEFKKANLAGGTGDFVESELWRAVIINAWNRGVPPPPPIGVDVPFNNSTWQQKVHDAIDLVNIGLSVLDTAADIFMMTRVAMISGPAGLVAGIVGGIVALPLTWAAADALARTNGEIQGAADAIQDMADQYSSDSLDRVGMSKWPTVKVPTPHLPSNPQPTVSQAVWRAGQVTGLKNAVKTVLGLEQHPKPFTLPDGQHIRISGRLWLRSISKAFGDNAGVEAVVVPANEGLKKRGRPPFPTH
jgi:outer membrane protein OmpA-like peptidoglycan-associated protein